MSFWTERSGVKNPWWLCSASKYAGNKASLATNLSQTQPAWANINRFRDSSLPLVAQSDIPDGRIIF